jgi:hypothetical protein
MPPSEQGDLDSQQEQWMDRSAESVNPQPEEPIGEASPELVSESEYGDLSAAGDDTYLQVLEARETEITPAPLEEGLTPGLAL